MLPIWPESGKLRKWQGLCFSEFLDSNNTFTLAAGYGIPYQVVDASTPRSSVSFTWPGESDAGPYPIPDPPLIEGGRELQALDRDELPESGMNPAIDDAEPSVAHDGRDAVLAFDGRPAELEGVGEKVSSLRGGGDDDEDDEESDEDEQKRPPRKRPSSSTRKRSSSSSSRTRKKAES